MSNRLSSVYHGMESRQDAEGAGQKASFSRPLFHVGGAIAALVVLMSVAGDWAEIGLVSAAIILGVLVVLAKNLLVGLTIVVALAGAFVGFVFGLVWYSYMVDPFPSMLVATAIGAGAGALLVRVIASARRQEPQAGNHNILRKTSDDN